MREINNNNVSAFYTLKIEVSLVVFKGTSLNFLMSNLERQSLFNLHRNLREMCYAQLSYKIGCHENIN